MKVLAVLDTMYNWKRLADGHTEAPRYFQINPRNHTGKRLYKLIGPGNQLLVTDCCREIGVSSTSHGTPDPEWLKENLSMLRGWANLILVCGNVASKTYDATGFTFPHVRKILHPAARTWTKELLEQTAKDIQSLVV